MPANPFTTSPAYVPLSPAQAAQRIVSRATVLTPKRTAKILRWATEQWLAVWFNEDGLTPQQACDAFGVNALWMLSMGQATAAWYAAICPTAPPVLTPPAGCTVAPNIVNGAPDGTIAIGGWDVSMQAARPQWAIDAMEDPAGAQAMV